MSKGKLSRRRKPWDGGFLRIVDRKEHMIPVSSGFTVYPNGIEALVSAAPGLAERACVGLPDEESGAAVDVLTVRSAAVGKNLRRALRG